VQAVETSGGHAAGVVALRDGREETLAGDLVALGANGLFNAHVLLRSGLAGAHGGRGLTEQVGVSVRLALDGRGLRLGSTSITGLGFMFYDGPHRATHAAALVETTSLPAVLERRGRMVQGLLVRLVFEDLPRPDSVVAVDPGDPTRPVVTFAGRSDYALRGVGRAAAYVEALTAHLPVRDVEILPPAPTEAHILGTTVMGNDPARSVVDRELRHHRVRNLLVLGSGAFPTAAPANPTLTLSALSLWAARRLWRA
jgi:choline dehydrogenase-like flavoprotein